MGMADTERTVELVAAHLRRRLQQSEGSLYVKSRFVAEEMSFSAQQIGTALGRLADRDGDPTVERWANSGGSLTWRVS
jgi:hypothetical protein